MTNTGAEGGAIRRAFVVQLRGERGREGERERGERGRVREREKSMKREREREGENASRKAS